MFYGKGGLGEKTAKAILAEAKKQNLKLWESGLFVKPSFSVLRKTVAPAVLIEHAFHSNEAECKLLKSSAYRDKLAEIDARGICESLGAPINSPVEKPADKESVHDEAFAWAKANGITDGSNLESSPTKAEILSLLYRNEKRKGTE